jgi:hypothetical protein
VQAITISLKALVASSIFFVWVVRYENIDSEFNQFGNSNWLRGLFEILKLTFSILLLVCIKREQFAVVAGIGISLLMLLLTCGREVRLFDQLVFITLLMAQCLFSFSLEFAY